MIEALIAGQDTAERVADLACGQLRRKLKELARALDAPLKPHQRFMLRTHRP